jgi:hypothetical protein
MMYVEAWLGRNEPSGAWQYPPPPDLSPANLDWNTWLGTAPKIPFNPEVFARWRAWKEYGTGVAGDLLVHLMSGFLFMSGINKPPSQTLSVGGIRRWKDGRNTPDVHLISYDYDGLPVNMRLNLGTAIQGAGDRGAHLPRPWLRRHPGASLELLRGRADQKARRRGRALRASRRARVPPGERVVLSASGRLANNVLGPPA